MKTLIVLIAMVSAQAASADGFRCQTVDGDLNLKIYNQTSPEMGTRSAATMVLSDPHVGHGRKTIAKFSAEKGTLTSKEVAYTANVDLRFVDSSAKGENIAGTKLGELDTIKAAIGFSYNNPVADGTELAGRLVLVKRNGQKIYADLACERYLKN